MSAFVMTAYDLFDDLHEYLNKKDYARAAKLYKYMVAHDFDKRGTRKQRAEFGKVVMRVINEIRDIDSIDISSVKVITDIKFK